MASQPLRFGTKFERTKMTLAELQVKVENALKNNVGFTEQVKITLEVVWEQITALKTLDGYYTKEINEFIKLNQKNAELNDTAQELLESVKTQYDTINELIAKVESVRNEAENVINKRIDELLVPIVYKSGYPIKANQPVIYAGAIYLAKEAFTTSTWESDKGKLIAQTGSGSTSTSNLYAAGKEIKKGELITYENKLYISQSDFVATTWETDSGKFIEFANNENTYKADVAFGEGDLYTYEGVLYIALSAFTSTTWAEDENKFARYNANSSKAKNYAENLVIEKGDSVFYNSKIYIAKETFTATQWTADESKFIALENGSNAYTAGKEVGLGDTITYENKVYIAKEAFTATTWETDSSKLVEITSDTNGVDLTAYYTKDEIDAFMAQKMDLLTAGEGVAIDKSDGNITVGVKNYTEIMDTLKTINVNLDLNTAQMGFKIDFTKIGKDSVEPAEYITPLYDLVGATKTQILDEFLGACPLILSPNSTEFNKLNPNNYTQFADGSDASQYIITLGNDVMVTQPQRGLKLHRLSDNVGELIITNGKDKSGFTYNAFRDGDTLKDKIYIGAYEAYASGGKLYSTSGQAPCVNTNLSGFRNLAAARGTGYRIINFHQRTYLQACYLLVHQDLLSQRAVGMGFANMSAASKTGLANEYGANCEIIKASNPTYMTDGKHAVKCNYYENLWGNVWEWTDGFLLVGFKIHTSTGNFNDAALGYTDNGYAFAAGTSNNNIAMVAWDNERGFYPTQIGGTQGKNYFGDGIWQASGCGYLAGGRWADGASCGALCLAADDGVSAAGATLGSRLVYM